MSEQEALQSELKQLLESKTSPRYYDQFLWEKMNLNGTLDDLGFESEDFRIALSFYFALFNQYKRSLYSGDYDWKAIDQIPIVSPEKGRNSTPLEEEMLGKFADVSTERWSRLTSAVGRMVFDDVLTPLKKNAVSKPTLVVNEVDFTFWFWTEYYDFRRYRYVDLAEQLEALKDNRLLSATIFDDGKILPLSYALVPAANEKDKGRWRQRSLKLERAQSQLISSAAQAGFNPKRLVFKLWNPTTKSLREFKEKGIEAVGRIGDVRRVSFLYKGRRTSVFDLFQTIKPRNADKKGHGLLLKAVIVQTVPDNGGGVDVKLFFFKDVEEDYGFHCLISTETELGSPYVKKYYNLCSKAREVTENALDGFSGAYLVDDERFTASLEAYISTCLLSYYADLLFVKDSKDRRLSPKSGERIIGENEGFVNMIYDYVNALKPVYKYLVGNTDYTYEELLERAARYNPQKEGNLILEALSEVLLYKDIFITPYPEDTLEELWLIGDVLDYVPTSLISSSRIHTLHYYREIEDFGWLNRQDESGRVSLRKRVKDIYGFLKNLAGEKGLDFPEELEKTFQENLASIDPRAFEEA